MHRNAPTVVLDVHFAVLKIIAVIIHRTN